jgi:hypothetical protein
LEGKRGSRVIKSINWSAFRPGYTKESTILGSMLTELDEADNVQVQTAIGATVMVDALKAAQQEFAQVMSEKTETEAQDAERLTATPKIN